jgi:DNA-binding IclR family transcriptional regulator
LPEIKSSSEDTAVVRAMAVLELLSQHKDGLSVTEVATTLRQAKTTSFRILSTLKALGYVEQDSRVLNYALSFKLFTLAHRLLAERGLEDVCRPPLQALSRETGELCRVAIVDDRQLRWLVQENGNASRVRLYADIGTPIALHASASGKAWLATLSPREADEIVRAHPLDARTPKTIIDPDEFSVELGRVRKRGYALALEEGENGICAVAVPIRPRTPSGPVFGTVSISGTIVSVDKKKLESFVPALQRTADEIAAVWPAGADARVLDRSAQSD